MSGDGIFLTMAVAMTGSCVGMVVAMLGFLRAKRDLELTRQKDVDLRPYLTELREEVDAMNLTVERLAESQRFMAQLQIERAETLRLLQKDGAQAR